MADLEKVINGLIMHKTGLCNVLTASGKEYCPYWENNDNCMLELLNDALSLLKAQEPKFVSDIAEAIIGCKPKVKVGHCLSCGVLMSETDRYCRKCGQAVKWE